MAIGRRRDYNVPERAIANTGQEAALYSVPVVIATDQTAIPVNVSVGGTALAMNAGAANAQTQRVIMASDSPDVTSLAVIDDWDESDRCKVNPIVGQAGVAAGSGVTGVTTQRVVLATDVALPAGENHIGQVGSHTTVVSVTPTVSTAAYTSADVLGDLQEIANAARVAAGSGIINYISISSKAATASLGLIRIIFFKSVPTDDFVDAATLAINSADYDKVLGHVDFVATDWANLGTNEIATLKNVNIPFKLASGTSLYAVAQINAALDLAGTTDLTFNYGILQD